MPPFFQHWGNWLRKNTRSHFCQMGIRRHQEQFEKCLLILQSLSDFLFCSEKDKIWQALGGIVSSLYMHHWLGFQFLSPLDSLGQFHEQSQCQSFLTVLQGYYKLEALEPYSLYKLKYLFFSLVCLHLISLKAPVLHFCTFVSPLHHLHNMLQYFEQCCHLTFQILTHSSYTLYKLFYWSTACSLSHILLTYLTCISFAECQTFPWNRLRNVHLSSHEFWQQLQWFHASFFLRSLVPVLILHWQVQ